MMYYHVYDSNLLIEINWHQCFMLYFALGLYGKALTKWKICNFTQKLSNRITIKMKSETIRKKSNKKCLMTISLEFNVVNSFLALSLPENGL